MKSLTKSIKMADKALECIINKGLLQSPNYKQLTTKDVVIIAFFENMIGHAKSLKILLENNHHSSIDSIVRTFFENYVYLKFILEEDSQKRATAYLYSLKVEDHLLFDQITNGDEVGRSLRSYLGLTTEELKKDFLDTKKVFNLEEVEQMYLKELGMQRLNQKWYNLYTEKQSLNNFSKLCEKLGLIIEYKLIYSILSLETHGKDAMQKLEIEPNFFSIKNPNSKNPVLCLNLTTSLLEKMTRELYITFEMKDHLKNHDLLLSLNKHINYKTKSFFQKVENQL